MPTPAAIPAAALLPLVSAMRTDTLWVRSKPGTYPAHRDLKFTPSRLAEHLDPDKPDYGLAFILPGTDTTRVALLDFDSHGGEVDFDGMRDVASLVEDELILRGLVPIAFRSSGGRGIHFWLIWEEPQDAYSARKCLASVLSACELKPGTKGVVAGEVEVFPKQDFVAADGFGNMAILPLAGKSVPMSPAGLLPREHPIDWALSTPVPVLERPVRDLTVATPTVELEELRRALMAIPQDTAPLDYDEWRNVMFAIHHATGGDGIALAHEFSSRSTKYDPDFLDTRVWPYIRDDREGGITDGYILGLAAQHGFNPTTADDFDDLGDPEDEYATAGNPVIEPNQRLRFPCIPAHEFASHIVAAHWLIKNTLPREGLAVVYGASGSGKTFMVLDMAMAVARGVEWRNLRTHKGRVVYVAAEGQTGFRKRLRAYAQQTGSKMQDVHLHIIAGAPSLLARVDVADTVASIRAAGGADLIILDTLAQVTAGANENSGEDMGRALKAAQALSRVFGCLVLLVHHSGKDETKGARGWSGIKGALDTELEVTRAEDDRVLSVTKQKDGEEGQEYGFRLLEVPLWGEEDEDGDPITSCVVEPNETGRSEIKKRKALSPEQQAVRDVVLSNMDSDGWADIETVILDVQRGAGDKVIRASSVRRSVKRLVECRVLAENNGKVRDSSWASSVQDLT